MEKLVFYPELYKPLTPKDMELKVSKEMFLGNVIIDGKIMHKNLRILHKDEEWLLKELKIKGYKDISRILLCTLDEEQKVTIYEKNENIEILDILE